MSNSKIFYRIIPSNPAAHIFTIACTITQPDPHGQIVWLPAWIPGSYMVRDFARNVISLQARDKNGQLLTVEKLDKQTWQFAPCIGSLEIEYEVYAYDLSVRSAHLDTTHAFFNGSSVFLAVKDQEDQPVTVEILLPEQDFAKNWRVATTLTRLDTPLFSAGHYAAENYDELIDHPVEIGDFNEINFQVNAIPHHIIISGRQQADLERLAEDVQRICQTQVGVFEELPVMERYMFLLQVVGDGYGGLEHRSSCSLVCSRKDLPVKSMTTPNDGYVTLLGLFSHEYFHTWNVKRIKPAEFMPYELRHENYTRLLWAFEGITSYYDDLGLIRSGVISEKKYLELLGKTITRVLRGSGRLKQTLRESSFDAWTRFYKQDENAPNAIVSYYAKGALFALSLDLKLRELSNQSKSLDDVMRRLWQENGKPGVGVKDISILTIANEICGQSLDDFFSRYLDTVEDLPLEKMLVTMGVALKSRIAESPDDMGGTPAKPGISPSCFNLGARFLSDPLGAKIQILFEGGDLQNAGFAANDVLIAIDGIKVSKDNLQSVLSPYQSGDKPSLHAFRRDELLEYEVTLTNPLTDTWYLEANEQNNRIHNLSMWLGLK